MDGWLKLHRKILCSKQFANPTELKIWIWLLCKASITDRFVNLKIGKGTQTIAVKRGQLIFGRNKAEAELHIDGSTIYKVIQRLSEDNAIKIESNNQFSIITILQFNEYQQSNEVEEFEIMEEVTTEEQPKNNQTSSKEQPNVSQVTSKEQPSNKQVTHKEKVKEGLNGFEKKESTESKKSGKTASVKNAVLDFSNYKDFVNTYFEFYEGRNGGPPRFKGRDGDGIKEIAAFMKAQAKAKHPDTAPEELEIMALDGFKWLLSKWDSLTPYLQQKISPDKMANEINEIFNHLKNLKNGKQLNGFAGNSKIDDSGIQAMHDEIDRKYG